MNMPFDNQIPEQLLHHANMAEQWFLEQKYNPDDYVNCNPSNIFQAARKLSKALETVPTPEEPSLEWRIFLHAHTELAQMVTAVLSELTQGRQISCLILLRPAQELAQTIWHALKEEKLVEWYQYSIKKDIKDWETLIPMMEETLKSGQYSRAITESAKEEINQYKAKIEELKNQEIALGNQRSDKELKELRESWEKGFAERLEGIRPKARLEYMHIYSWIMLNGYVHATKQRIQHPARAEHHNKTIKMDLRQH